MQINNVYKEYMQQAQALDILKSGANVFLTGEPGAGKTHIINLYTQYLRECSVERAVTASTGIAATHIGGMTIHSWSGIGVKNFLSPQDLDALSSKESLFRRVERAKALIIDEISMLDANCLDMVDSVCSTIKQNSEPFGGMQMIFVGDFFQLPPVSRQGRVAFAFEAMSWNKANPITCYLEEQYRQEDKEFLGVLSALRHLELNQSHRGMLWARLCFSAEEQKQGRTKVPKLYTHNVDVDALNNAELLRLKSESRIYEMETSGARSRVEQLQRGCLSPVTLELKKGAIVMFTKNDFAGAFVNGTVGVVEDFDKDDGFPIVLTKKRRIKTEMAEWRIEDAGKALARIKQIPLRLAWAITVHKSQGLSLTSAQIDLSRAFAYGQGYVALSRVRTLDGLFLSGLNERALEVDPRIVERDREFRSASLDAENVFGRYSQGELMQMQKDFVLQSGGKIPNRSARVRSASKARNTNVYNTCAVTLELLLQGKNIKDIAKERGMVQGTILHHVDRLIAHQELQKKEVQHIFPKSESFRNIAKNITKTFNEFGAEHYKPVYDYYKGKYDYDAIRLAVMYGKLYL